MKPKKYFLGVGVNEHQYNSTKLKGCDNDATLWEGTLKNWGFDTTTTPTILTQDASFNKIENDFKRFISNLKSKDLGVFFFSGHGVYRRYGGQLGFEAISCKDNFIRDDQITDWIDKNLDDEAFLILIFDCCFAGGIINYEKNSFLPDDEYFPLAPKTYIGGMKTFTTLETKSKNKIESFNPSGKQSNVLVITACGENRLAQEAKFGGIYHGVFTHFAIQSLDENRDYNQYEKDIIDRIYKAGYDQVPQVLGTPENKTLKLFKNKI